MICHGETCVMTFGTSKVPEDDLIVHGTFTVDEREISLSSLIADNFQQPTQITMTSGDGEDITFAAHVVDFHQIKLKRWIWWQPWSWFRKSYESYNVTWKRITTEETSDTNKTSEEK